MKDQSKKTITSSKIKITNPEQSHKELLHQAQPKRQNEFTRQMDNSNKGSMNLFQKAKQAQLQKYHSIQNKITSEQIQNQSSNESCNSLQTVEIKNKVVQSQIELDDQNQQNLEQQKKLLKRMKELEQLKKTLSKTDGKVQELAELRMANDDLKERFKTIVEERQALKLKIKLLQKKPLKVNREAEDMLDVLKIEEQKLESTYYRCLEEVKEKEADIEALERILNKEEAYIEKLKQSNYELRQERENLVADIQVLEENVSQDLQKGEIKKMKVDEFRRMRRHQIAVAVLNKTLRMLVQNNVTRCSFQNIKNTWLDHIKLASFQKSINNILMKRKIKEQGRYLQQWKQRTKSQQIYSENVLYSTQLKINNPLKLKYFSLWRQRLDVKILKDIERQRAVADLFTFKQSKIDTEMIVYSFQVWKLLSSKYRHRDSFLNILIKKKEINNKSLSFKRWTNECKKNEAKKEDLQLLRQRMSKQLMIRAFYGLKEGITIEKLDKYELKLRIYKQWRKQFLQNKFVKGMDNFAIDAQTSENELLLKQKIYNSFKTHSQLQKLSRQRKEYQNNVEDPFIENNKQVEYLLKTKKESCDSSLKKVAMMLTYKQLQQYWNRWKDDKDQMQKAQYLLVFRRLKNIKLNFAFNQWKWQSYTFQSQVFMSRINEYQESSKELLNQVMGLQKQNQQLDQKKQAQTQLKLIKVLSNQNNILCGSAFYKWTFTIVRKSHIVSKLQHILFKFENRSLKQYFTRFKQSSQALQKHQRNQNVTQNYLKLQESRQLRRIFKLMIENKHSRHRQKRYLQILIKRKDIGLRRKVVNKWKAIANEKHIEFVNCIEMDEIQGAINKNSDVIVKQSKVQDQKSQITKSEKMIELSSLRIIKKYAKIIEQKGIIKCFVNWRQRALHSRKLGIALRNILYHQDKQAFMHYFNSWSKESQKKKQQAMNTKSIYIQKCINEKNVQLGQIKRELGKRILQLQQKLSEEEAQSTKYQHTIRGVIEHMFQQKTKNLKIKLHHYIFMIWKQSHQNMKRKLKQAIRISFNSLAKYGFEKINSMKKKCNHTQEKTKDVWLWKVIRKLHIKQVSIVFRQWQQQNFKKINKDLKDISILCKERQVQTIGNRKLSHFSINKSQNNIKQLMHHWQAKVKQRKLMKRKSTIIQENQQYRQIRRCLASWQQFIQQEKIRKTKIRFILQKYNRILINSTFQQLVNDTKDVRLKQHLLKKSINPLIQLQLKKALQTIQSYCSKQIQDRHSHLFRGIKFIDQSVKSINQRLVQSAFSSLAYAIRKQLIQQLILKQALTKLSNVLRKPFAIWKQLIQLHEAKEDAYDYSEARQQFLKDYQTLYNLTNFVQDKAKISADTLQQYLLHEGKRHSTLMIKSIYRMKHFNKARFYKPKYFDILKQHAFTQRYLKSQLRGILNKYHNKIRQTFELWRAPIVELKLHYERQSRESLQDRLMDVRHMRMNSVNQSISKYYQYEAADRTCETLIDIDQRSKRLAVRLIVKRRQNILRQAFVKWSAMKAKDNNSDQSSFKNMYIIEELKQKIRSLQTSNNDFQTQNESYQIEAMKGLEFASQIQELSDERSQIMVDLADRTFQMRKLVEENNNLNVRLSQSKMYGSLSKGFESTNSLLAKSINSQISKSANFKH